MRRFPAYGLAFILALSLAGCGGSSSNSTPPPPLAITTQSLASASVAYPYVAALGAMGGVLPYKWTVISGSLPTGLSLTTSGLLSGTPTASGTFNFTAQVADSAHPSGIASAALSIDTADQLKLTTLSLPAGTTGVPYSAVANATGGFPPYSWSIANGSLPSGLTLSAASGAISGAPTGEGISNFTLQVSDSPPTASARAGLSITVNAQPARNAVIYNPGIPPAQIQSDGSLIYLSMIGPFQTSDSAQLLTPSPTLPLLFTDESDGTHTYLRSYLVNANYSTSLSNSTTLPYDNYTFLALDPGGSNVYLGGPIDSSLTPGLVIYTGDGSSQLVGSIATPDGETPLQAVFTPDSATAFVQTCSTSSVGNIYSYSRTSGGMLSRCNLCDTSEFLLRCLGSFARWKVSREYLGAMEQLRLSAPGADLQHKQ